MTNTAWKTYFADFMQQVRAALPNIEIVHNSLWYLNDGSDPNIQREIQAADWINAERGVNDPGLTGGTGYWSYDRFLTVVDNVHFNGKEIVFDTEADNTETDVNREYSISSYLLISSGKDMVGDTIETPTNWYPGFDIDLGAAQGARYSWNGLYRRDFERGMVLVNPPPVAPPGIPVTVSLPGTYTRVDGTEVTSIILEPTQGAILIANLCDVNGDGVVNVADVQLEVKMALGLIPCTNPSSQCTVAQVQRVVNAAQGGVCITP
jgi:hypothetical protein